MADTFLTTTRRDFKWPYPKPISLRPVQPKIVTKPKGYYMARPLAAYCHCDSHAYDGELNQYAQLVEKENILLQELLALSQKQVAVTNAVLDHPCNTDDEKMETIYQIDYKKRGLNIPRYKKIMADVDSNVADPIRPPIIGLLEGYRDPTMFRYSALVRPTIDPCPPVTFKMTPELIKAWFRPITGRSEYQDTISRNGSSIIKARQQYKEPLPSSRRRFGDPCL